MLTHSFCSYLSTTSDVLNSVKKMEESLKRLKKGKAATNTDGMTDDDKIRLQLYLDVRYLGEQVSEQVVLREGETKRILKEKRRNVGTNRDGMADNDKASCFSSRHQC